MDKRLEITPLRASFAHTTSSDALPNPKALEYFKNLLELTNQVQTSRLPWSLCNLVITAITCGRTVAHIAGIRTGYCSKPATGEDASLFSFRLSSRLQMSGEMAKIRRMHIREGLPLREIARQTGLSRNTVRQWLRQTDLTEPKYPKRTVKRNIDPWSDQLRQWLQTDSHRARRERRTVRVLHKAIQVQGYSGSYNRVCAFVRRWRDEVRLNPKRAAYVPLSFALGEAFQFDWSGEYVFVGGLRRRLEVAHMKLCAN